MCYYRKIKTMMLLMLACLAAKAQLSDGKVYNFVNVGNSSSSMSIISNNNISIAATDTSDYGQLWHATMNDDGSYSLRNLANGRYLRSSNATSVAWTMVKADGLDANCKLGSLSAGSGYTLRATNTTGAYNCMHYASNVGRIVCWESSNPATQWTMNVVDINESELEANWAKLAAIDPEAVTVAGYQTALDNLFSDKACTVLKKIVRNGGCRKDRHRLSGIARGLATDGTQGIYSQLDRGQLRLHQARLGYQLCQEIPCATLRALQ